MKLPVTTTDGHPFSLTDCGPDECWWLVGITDGLQEDWFTVPGIHRADAKQRLWGLILARYPNPEIVSFVGSRHHHGVARFPAEGQR